MAEADADDSRAHFLLVDDARVNLLVLEVLLAAPDRVLVSAASGFEALKHVRRRRFDLILLDAQMPRLDGYQTARLIRQLEHGRNTPIIMLSTADHHDEHERRGYEVGAVDYLTKPIDPDVLRPKVAVFAELHKRTRELHDAQKSGVDGGAALDTTRSVLALISEAVVVADANSRIVMLNERAAEVFASGTSGPTVPLANANRALQCAEFEGPRLAIARAIASGITTRREPIHLPSANGGAIDAYLSVAPVHAGTDIAGAVAVIEEVDRHPEYSWETRLVVAG